MPICEACSISFQEVDGAVEVVTTRVLCPSCLAEYKAAKAARKAAGATARPAPAVTSPARASGAAGASAAARETSAPAAREAASAAPRPAAPRETSSPAPRPTAPKSATNAKPANAVPVARNTSPAAARPIAPPPKKAAPTEEAGAVRRTPPRKRATDVEFIQRETEALRKRETRTMWIGAILAVVMLGVAGGVVYVVLGKRAQVNAADAAHKKEVDDFRTQFMAIDITTEEGAKQVIALGDEKRSLWENEDIAPEIQSRFYKAKTQLEQILETKGLLERLAQVETTLADPAAVPADQLLEIRRVIDDIDSKSSFLGAEAVARLGVLRGLADKSYAQRLLDEARASAASEGGTPALTKYARAEEEIYKILEKASKAKDEEATKYYQDTYKTTVEESDALSAKAFDATAIEATPWRDLLASGESGNWLAPALEGFEHRIENGELHLIGPGPQATAQGIISIGDKENWRDFVVELEYTIVKGSFTTYFRAGPSVADHTARIDFTVNPEDTRARNAGEAYRTTITYIGGTFVQTDEGDEPWTDTSVNWTFRRKGAIAIVIPREAEVRITKLRIRLLR